MPVTFHPENPIGALESIIVKEDGTPLYGEIDIYKLLYNDLENSSKNWHIWHSLRLPVHGNLYNPFHKTNSEIDFVILSEEGLLVLEVKGGAISCRDSQFFYGDFEKPIKDNPFTQANGYKYTLKDKILNDKNLFFCHAVAFPHAYNSFRNPTIDHEILWTANSPDRFSSFEDFIIHVFDYNRNNHQRQGRTFSKISKGEVENIVKRLSPIINDPNRYIRTDTTQWLNVENLDILESLEKNERLMIEGGPGTGKTTMAKAFIDKQFAKKGLFLCWNNLLMLHTKSILKERLLDCKVTTVIRFLKDINPKIDLFNLTADEFYSTTKEILSTYKGEKYDYLIIDEAQDVFDRGIDLFLNMLLIQNDKGVENGKYLLLYDLEQGYFTENRNIIEFADYFSEYCAHFKLNENKRSIQNPSIKKLAYSVLEYQENSNSFLNKWKESNSAVRIHQFNKMREVKTFMIENVIKGILDPHNSLKGNDCVLLAESSIMKDNNDVNEDFKILFKNRYVEELTENNITDTKNTLMYTTILKYKGLEKKNVFLILKNLSSYNKLEYFIGITRAISNLEILILNN